jgi:UDP-glucose 4-epimerase
VTAGLQSLRDGGASTQYNLGNGRPTSVRTVIESVARVVEDTDRPVDTARRWRGMRPYGYMRAKP